MRNCLIRLLPWIRRVPVLDPRDTDGRFAGRAASGRPDGTCPATSCGFLAASTQALGPQPRSRGAGTLPGRHTSAGRRSTASIHVTTDRSHLPTSTTRLMQASPEFLFDLLELGPHPLAHRLSQHDELPLPGLAATVREAQEVERLRLAFAPSAAAVRFAKRPNSIRRVLSGCSSRLNLRESLAQVRPGTARPPADVRSPPRSRPHTAR